MCIRSLTRSASSSSTPTRAGSRFVTIVGDDEAARGEVAVKNLATGEQQALPRAAVASFHQECERRIVTYLMPDTCRPET